MWWSKNVVWWFTFLPKASNRPEWQWLFPISTSVNHSSSVRGPSYSYLACDEMLTNPWRFQYGHERCCDAMILCWGCLFRFPPILQDVRDSISNRRLLTCPSRSDRQAHYSWWGVGPNATRLLILCLTNCDPSDLTPIPLKCWPISAWFWRMWVALRLICYETVRFSVPLTRTAERHTHAGA